MKRKGFELNKEISIGDVLTSTSILISITALLFSWSQSRAIERREQANQVRNAAAQTIAKLERWEEISISIFDEIQPSVIETSEQLSKKETNSDVTQSRDYLYKKIRLASLETQHRLRNEQIETAYVYLYSYHPLLRQSFQDVLTEMKKEEKLMLDRLLSETQNEVLEYYDSGSEDIRTSEVGNALRAAINRIEADYESQLKTITQPIETFLAELVLSSDSLLLSQRNLRKMDTKFIDDSSSD